MQEEEVTEDTKNLIEIGRHLWIDDGCQCGLERGCWGCWSRKVVLALEQAEARAKVADLETQWRCFHCNEIFTNPKHAAEHFGVDETSTPGCRLTATEGHLVTYIRRLEKDLDEYRDDRHPLILAHLSDESARRLALQREEEVGYARGVLDSEAACAGMREALEYVRPYVARGRGEMCAYLDKIDAALATDAGRGFVGPDELRPEVLAFAVEMERRLRENDHRPGWKQGNPLDLVDRIRDEVRELELEVVGRFGTDQPRGFILNEAADVANISMMVADLCGGLIPKKEGDVEVPDDRG